MRALSLLSPFFPLEEGQTPLNSQTAHEQGRRTAIMQKRTQAENDKQLAARYLTDNQALRDALGILPGAALEPHYLGEGEHNRNFWFADPESSCKYVLRINIAPQPFHSNQIAYEFGALRLLEPCGRAPKPLYVDDSPQAPGKGALVESFCEGKQLDFDHLQPGELLCAVQIMADLHAVALPKPSTSVLYQPDDPLRDLFNECLARFQAYRASGVEDPKLTRWTERFILAAQDALETPCSPEECNHVVNTETLAAHFLIPEDSAKRAKASLTRDPEATAQRSAQSNTLDAASPDPHANVTDDKPEGVGQTPAQLHARHNAPPDLRANAAASEPNWRENPGFFVDWERPIIGEVAQDLAYFVAPTTTFWDSSFFFTADEAAAVVESYWRAVDGRFPRGNFDARFNAFRMMTALRSTTWFCKALPVYLGVAEGHMTESTRKKFPQYLADDFMEMLARDCFGL